MIKVILAFVLAVQFAIPLNEASLLKVSPLNCCVPFFDVSQGEGEQAIFCSVQYSSGQTGVRWQRKWRETGAISPDVQGRPPGHGKLAAHQGLLEELVAQDGDITLPELAGALASATGVVAHAASIGRFLRKLGYTYKKVTGRDRTAARTGQTPTARMAAIPHPQNADASRSDCIH